MDTPLADALALGDRELTEEEIESIGMNLGVKRHSGEPIDEYKERIASEMKGTRDSNATMTLKETVEIIEEMLKEAADEWDEHRLRNAGEIEAWEDPEDFRVQVRVPFSYLEMAGVDRAFVSFKLNGNYAPPGVKYVVEVPESPNT